MSKARSEERTVKTPNFRVSFPTMFVPSQINGQGEAKYGVAMIFEPDTDLSVLKAAAKIAAEDKFGMDSGQWPAGMASPFKSGTEINDKREARGKGRFAGYDGNIIINTTSLEKPGLVDPNSEDIIQKSEFYAGCYARAQVYAHAYDTAGNIGVTFFLNAVQKVGDGEAFSGRKDAKDIFAAIPGAAPSPAAPASNDGGGLFD